MKWTHFIYLMVFWPTVEKDALCLHNSVVTVSTSRGELVWDNMKYCFIFQYEVSDTHLSISSNYVCMCWVKLMCLPAIRTIQEVSRGPVGLQNLSTGSEWLMKCALTWRESNKHSFSAAHILHFRELWGPLRIDRKAEWTTFEALSPMSVRSA